MVESARSAHLTGQQLQTHISMLRGWARAVVHLHLLRPVKWGDLALSTTEVRTGIVSTVFSCCSSLQTGLYIVRKETYNTNCIIVYCSLGFYVRLGSAHIFYHIKFAREYRNLEKVCQTVRSCTLIYCAQPSSL